MSEPTNDSVPEGTQIPDGPDPDAGHVEPGQDQDAGVADTGTEEWYGHTVPKGEI
jgi:hypothetical protein